MPDPVSGRGPAWLLALAAACLVAPSAGAETTHPTTQPQTTAPVLVEFVEADYPPDALAARHEATVTLEIVVDAQGRSSSVKVVTSAGEGFDEAAAAAAAQFVWTAGTRDGKPVAVRVRFDYHFELPAAPAFAPASAPAQAATASLAGTVRERGTRRPLPMTTVVARRAVRPTPSAEEEEATATTDDQGAFTLPHLPAGAYHVVVALPGHKTGQFDETLSDGESLAVRYILSPTGDDPYQAVVEGERVREEVERRSATAAEATRIPGTRGDALRVVETFPGVARPPIGLGALIVRGSNPQDTTVLIDGDWVPLLYHFGGITSIINSDLLERIDFLPGNFSARFGRATGGVVEVDLRAPRRDRPGGYVDVSLLDAGFLLEGPVGRGSFALAARRSYIDAILSAVLPADAGFNLTTAPRYWDYQAILDYPVGGGRLKLAAFGSSDRLELVLANPAANDPSIRGTIGTSTYVQRLQASYTRKLDDATSVRAQVVQGINGVRFNVGQTLDLEILAWFNSFRLEVTHQPWPAVRVTAGLDGQIYPFHVTASGPRPPSEGQVPLPPSAQPRLTQDRSDWEWRQGAYVEAAFDLGRGLTITPGARFDYSRLIDRASSDPRLTARWVLGDHVVRAGFGRYSQSPQEYQTDPVYGNPRLGPESALHASVGYDRQVTPALRVESTLFYKYMTNLVVPSSELTLRDGRVVPLGVANDGTGRVYGLELLARYSGPRFFGWLSYTLSRAERQDTPDGEYRPFTFDQTHILTLVGSLRLPWRLTGGLRFRYVTGNAATPIVGSIFDADADTYVPLPGATNSDRVEPYHELDVRLERRFLFDSWILTAYIDVQNAYNRANPEGFAYSYDYRQRQVISGIPIFPSLGVKGEF